MRNIFLSVAALNGLIGTACSALGAHALPGDRLSKTTQWFIQGAEFQLLHGLALLGIAIVIGQIAGKKKLTSFHMSFYAFQMGIILFSGSLYWSGIKGAGSLGAFHWITPIGGLFLMIGWILLVYSGLKSHKSHN